MQQGTQKKQLVGRILVISLIVVILVLSVIIAMLSVNRATVDAKPEEINVLSNSNNQCVNCHKNTTPGIVEQYGVSSMARADVTCEDCHEVAAGYPGSVEHEGTYVLNSPTTEMCQVCHTAEVAQFNQSRHGLPAYVAYNGTVGMSEEHLTMYQNIPEGSYAPGKSRNALFELEGEAITEFACKTCHDIGKPAPDGSVGQCQKCHLRHEFSLEQVRKPETCNACHIGPDHPQWEIYQESPHGIAYATGGDNWNWDADPGTMDAADFPAATCAICHMSGFGSATTTHDVGDRLAWYLFAPISERRPAYQDNIVRMQSVCLECHNENFIDEFYTKADAATEAVNDFVVESDVIRDELKTAGLLTDAPFDEPFDFTHFNLWHHWGRTAKFGTWMQGPDYVQWHGAYEILHSMSELKAIAEEKFNNAK
ncbi:MAG: nitrate reductase [Anaerolineaceae bacterium]|nr:nitrate reductase [Anaerolineaceae bacterium]